MTQVAVSSSPTVAGVEAIAAMANPVIRNLEITSCYADLSAAMRARTGDAADWCTFATWASRQAGSTIRGEDLLAALDRILGRRSWLLAPLGSLSRALLRMGLFQPGTRLGRVVAEIHSPLDAFELASAEVAKGNLKVFAEIGREFARFMVSVPVDAGVDSPEFLAFAGAFSLGPPPDGQDCLREAFTHYQQLRGESDPAARVAWTLLANLKIGFHEQTRLQPQIASAVDAPLTAADDIGDRVLDALFPGSRRWPRLLHGPAAAMIGWLAKRVRKEAVAVNRDVVTQAMMTLALPLDSDASRPPSGLAYTVLALGCDLSAPVPAILANSTHPFLDTFVKEYDQCPPGGIHCGAQDWCDLRQRMHYIVHLFRAYAEEPTLFSRPFTSEQVASFRAGIVPDGTL